jgi:DNA-binding CsgD family transcriptional regulator
MTCKEVAEKLGLTYNQVLGTRRYHDIKYTRRHQGKVTDYKLMYQMINDLVPFPQIGAALGVTPHAVAHYAAKIGHKRNGLIDEQAVIIDYEKMSIKKLEAKHGCSPWIVFRILKKHGITPHRARNKAG